MLHFTRTTNLLGILQCGLLGRSTLEKNGLPSAYNDSDRLDGHEDAVCLSVEFPNYRMFYKYSKNNPQDYAVLVLNPSILWELNCAFCRDNAGSNDMRSIPPEIRSNSNSLKSLYWDHETFRDELGIPDSYPTNPQAEILVFDHIASRYIDEVHFYTLTTKQKLEEDFYTQKVDKIPNFYHSGKYFTYRTHLTS